MEATLEPSLRHEKAVFGPRRRRDSAKTRFVSTKMGAYCDSDHVVRFVSTDHDTPRFGQDAIRLHLQNEVKIRQKKTAGRHENEAPPF